jgi:hypothetical protein
MSAYDDLLNYKNQGTAFLLLLTYLFTPWSRVLLERLTGSQLIKKFPAILRNPKVHYRIHKCPPPAPILSQIDPVHAPTFDFLRIHLNIILPIYAWVFQVASFPHVSSPKHCLNLFCPHTCYMPLPSYSSRFDHPEHVLDITAVFVALNSPRGVWHTTYNFERLSPSDGVRIVTMVHILVLWVMKPCSMVDWSQSFWWTYNENSGMSCAETSMTTWQTKRCRNQYGHSITFTKAVAWKIKWNKDTCGPLTGIRIGDLYNKSHVNC